MANLYERILGRIELVFWRLAVKLLSIARPLSKSAINQVQDLGSISAQQRMKTLPTFSWPLISALLGWALGILLGYILTIWLIQ